MLLKELLQETNELVQDFENRAANPSKQEPFINSQTFMKAKRQINEMFPDDVGTRNDYISKLENQYGLSRIEAAKRIFSETFPQGIKANILSEALNAIENQDPEFLKSLEKGSKEQEMYKQRYTIFV